MFDNINFFTYISAKFNAKYWICTADENGPDEKTVSGFAITPAFP